MVQVLVHLSPCSDPPYGVVRGADLSPANATCTIREHGGQYLAPTSALFDGPPHCTSANTTSGQYPAWGRGRVSLYHPMHIPSCHIARGGANPGAVLGNEDRFVSAAEGNTVTICILSPVTTLDEQDMDQPLVGAPLHSDLASSTDP